MKCNGYGQVRDITLEENNLTGTLPDEFLNFTASSDVQTLKLKKNYLEGDVTALLRDSRFNNIDLQMNAFTGTIPSPMGPRMMHVDLASNYLSGTLPSTTVDDGQTETLTGLLVSFNGISGTLPASLLRGKLSNFKAAGNMLSGTLPEDLFQSSIKKDYAWGPVELDDNLISGACADCSPPSSEVVARHRAR